MTMSDKQVLVDAVARISADVASISDVLKRAFPVDGEQDEPVKETPAPVSEKEYTYEEARAILAEKTRIGFRAEVKAILAKHGVTQLSDAKDPALLAAIVAEAEGIKVG